jgi:uncharacterized membrane protein YoaK (UPF0700 family)
MTAARAQVATALLLAVAAGTVDAVSFIVLHHTFTANMTGNTTELGIAVSHNDVFSLVPLAIAIVLFVGAIALGTAGIELATRRGVRATAAPAFLLEATLLTAFMLDGRRILRHNTAPDHAAGGFYALLALAILAMGVQTAALTKAPGATIRTTYVSGRLRRGPLDDLGAHPPSGHAASGSHDRPPLPGTCQRVDASRCRVGGDGRGLPPSGAGAGPASAKLSSSSGAKNRVWTACPSRHCVAFRSLRNSARRSRSRSPIRCTRRTSLQARS